MPASAVVWSDRFAARAGLALLPVLLAASGAAAQQSLTALASADRGQEAAPRAAPAA